MRKIRILLADDHTVVAEALLSCLKKSFDVLGIVTNGESLVAQIQKLRPEIVVSDIEMPGMSGLQALRQMRASKIDTKVIFLTMHSDAALARETLLAGASGYVLKDSAVDELVSAIRQVAAGSIYVSARIAREVMSPPRTGRASTTAHITPRQREVLQWIVTGCTMKEVGAALNLSRRTVETHKYEMMESLGVRTTAELVQYALRHHLVDQYAGAC